MAYFSHPASAPFASARHMVVSVAQSFGTFVSTVNRALMVNSTSHLRLQQVERLQAKSDAELAELGLKRDQIVHAVFRDFF